MADLCRLAIPIIRVQCVARRALEKPLQQSV
jgi:hypothetical protein